MHLVFPTIVSAYLPLVAMVTIIRILFPYSHILFCICNTGDGRNDSPGHSAQYCTYSLVEQTSRDLVAVMVVDKRETNLRSSTMELSALKRGIQLLKEKGVCVAEVTTDAHPQIVHLFSKLTCIKATQAMHGHFLKVTIC